MRIQLAIIALIATALYLVTGCALTPAQKAVIWSGGKAFVRTAEGVLIRVSEQELAQLAAQGSK